MKKITFILICLSLLLFFYGCSTKQKDDSDKTVKNTTLLPPQGALAVYNAGTAREIDFKAIAILPDNTTKDVTREAHWESLSPEVLSFDETGTPIILKTRKAKVRVTYNGFMATTDSIPVITTKPDPTGISRISIVLKTESNTSNYLFRYYKEQIQLKTIAHYSHNLIDDISDYVKWKSTAPYIVSVDEKGLLTAEGTGNAFISIDLDKSFQIEGDIRPENSLTLGERLKSQNNIDLEKFEATVNIPSEKKAFIAHYFGGSVVDNTASRSIDVVFPSFSVPEDINIELLSIREDELPSTLDSAKFIQAFLVKPEGFPLNGEATVNMSLQDNDLDALKTYKILFYNPKSHEYESHGSPLFDNDKMNFQIHSLGYWVISEKISRIKTAPPLGQNNTETKNTTILEVQPQPYSYLPCQSSSHVEFKVKVSGPVQWVTFTTRHSKNSFTDVQGYENFYSYQLYDISDMPDGTYFMDIHIQGKDGIIFYELPLLKKCKPSESDSLKEIELFEVTNGGFEPLSSEKPLILDTIGNGPNIMGTALFSDGKNYLLWEVFPDAKYIVENKKIIRYDSEKSKLIALKTGKTKFWIEIGDVASEKLSVSVEIPDQKKREEVMSKEGSIHIRGIKIQTSVAYLYDKKPIQLQAFFRTLDNNEKEVTDKVEWIASNPDVCNIEQKGILKAIGNGRGWIDARYKGKVARNGFFCIVNLTEEEKALIQTQSGGTVKTSGETYNLSISFSFNELKKDTNVILHILDPKDLPQKIEVADSIVAAFLIEPEGTVLNNRTQVSLDFMKVLPYKNYYFLYFDSREKRYLPEYRYWKMDDNGKSFQLYPDVLGYYRLS